MQLINFIKQFFIPLGIFKKITMNKVGSHNIQINIKAFYIKLILN